MANDNASWLEAVKGIKRLITNRHVDEIRAKEITIRQDKETSVTFDVLKKGQSVKKDDFSHMDGNLAKRFKRELFKPEATLDLHGVTEKDAFERVCDFVKNAYSQKKRCILIITGKGREEGTLFNEHGVLKQTVPNWLTNSEISSLVLAYKNPSPALGGEGALYILLRKNG